MTAQNIEHFKHIVQSGETLPAIVDKYGMTTNQISVFNPNLSENVFSGQSINIPLSSKGCINYKISSGETLYSISKRFQVSLNAIYEVNNISPETVVNVGRIIEIPVRQKDNNSVKKGCKLMYKVEKKETIYGICRKFNITEDEFIAANPQLRNEKLKKNKYVCIPYSNSEIEDAMASLTEVVEEVEDAFEVGIILPFGLSQKNWIPTTTKCWISIEVFFWHLKKPKANLSQLTSMP
jgi:LysM repeat protein